jgi:hypothetical protein
VCEVLCFVFFVLFLDFPCMREILFCFLSIYSFIAIVICPSYYKVVNIVLYSVSWLHSLPDSSYCVAAIICSVKIHVCPFNIAVH